MGLLKLVFELSFKSRGTNLGTSSTKNLWLHEFLFRIVTVDSTHGYGDECESTLILSASNHSEIVPTSRKTDR